MHGRDQGHDHPGHPRERHQHLGAAEGVHARLNGLRKLFRPLPVAAESRRAGVRGRESKGRSASAFLSPKTSCARSCAASNLKSVQEVLEIYGNGMGCEVCKPALSYMLDMLWCGDHDEDRSARFINDRVHANIQKDGTFSVVPRIRGGVTSPDELRRIADVADKYRVPHGEDHRQPAHRPAGREESGPAENLGRPWNALRSGLHQGRPHGEDLRGHGVLPLRRAGFHERRHRTGAAPRKSVHPAQSKDGRGRLPAQLRRSHGQRHRPDWAGGKLAGGGRRRRRQESSQSRPADHRRNHRSRPSKPRTLFFQYYRENANYLERTYDFVERLGIEKVRKETVYAPDAAKQGLLERLRKSKEHSSDAWLERDAPCHPTQFVQIKPLEEVFV